MKAQKDDRLFHITEVLRPYCIYIILLGTLIICGHFCYNEWYKGHKTAYFSKDRYDQLYHIDRHCPALAHNGGIYDSLEVKECRDLRKYECNICKTGYVYFSGGAASRTFHYNKTCPALSKQKNVIAINSDKAKLADLRECKICPNNTRESEVFSSTSIMIIGLLLMFFSLLIMYINRTRRKNALKPYKLGGKIFFDVSLAQSYDEDKDIYIHPYNEDGGPQRFLFVKSDGTILCDGAQFTSIIASRNTLPIVATVCYAGYKSKYKIIRIDAKGKDYVLCTSSSDYDYIGGVEKGLARVSKEFNYEKLWGVITTDGNIAVPVEYNTIWDFYNKDILHVRAEKFLHSEKQIRIVDIDLSKYISKEIIKANTFLAYSKNTFAPIHNIKFVNYKLFKQLSGVGFDHAINIIVGKNNCGKSSCLQGIETLLKFFSGSGLPSIDGFRLPYSTCKNIPRRFQPVLHSNIELSATIGECTISVIANDTADVKKIIIECDEHKRINEKVSITITKDNFVCSYGPIIVPLKNWWIVKSDRNAQANADAKVGNYIDGIVNECIGDNHDLRIVIAEIERSLMSCNGVEEINIFSTSKSECQIYIEKFAKYEEVSHDFICKWLLRFGIGSDFKLHHTNDEGIHVQIKKMDGLNENLFSLGSGSIHYIILLFRIMTKLYDHKDLSGHFAPLLLIQEPEQNLHPQLQSLLADFFVAVSDEYKRLIDSKDPMIFIIETHSEYLVRKTQVILAQKLKNNQELTLEDNPFKVYYFPSNGQPYDMEYSEDGYFEQSFGPGFFDAAKELTFNLSRIQRGLPICEQE